MIDNYVNEQIKEFWQLADTKRVHEKYKIDTNLQYLKFAPIEVLKNIFLQYRFFTHYYITDLAILLSKIPLNANSG